MSYQVLARKWRPRVFSQVVGQESVLRALINALDEQRLHHAYLFTGTRGVGKTTLARILAMCFNCEEGVSSTPCGKCAACREIKEGRFVDLIEVDAASRTKVEDTRELLDNVQYAPTRGRYKVYLIDEVHMLSSHSFNALLKTLEEPPEHVKFLLATTDPQKLPITVLSRCLQFNLKNMSADKIVGHLQFVLSEEQVHFEEPALWSLANAAQGSMRDALSLTDQAIAFGQGSISESQVNDMLGTLNRADVYALAQNIANAEVQSLFDEVKRLSEQAIDYDEVCQALMNLWHQVALAQISPDNISDHLGEKSAILTLAQSLQPEDVQLFYQITLSARQELPLACEPRQAFEMMLVRIMAFRPAENVPETLNLTTCLQEHKPQPVADLAPSRQGEKKNILVEPDTNSTLSATSETTELNPPQAFSSEPENTKENPVDFHKLNLEHLEPEPESLDAVESHTISDEAENSSGIESFEVLDNHHQAQHHIQNESTNIDFNADLNPEPSISIEPSHRPPSIESWHEDVETLNLTGMSLAILFDSALVNIVAPVYSEQGETHLEKKGVLEFDVSQNQSGLFSEGMKKRILSAVQAHWRDYEINMQVCEPRQETPLQRSKRVSSEQMHSAKEILKQDDGVELILNYFDGHVVESSIKPLTN